MYVSTVVDADSYATTLARQGRILSHSEFREARIIDRPRPFGKRLGSTLPARLLVQQRGRIWPRRNSWHYDSPHLTIFCAISALLSGSYKKVQDLRAPRLRPWRSAWRRASQFLPSSTCADSTLAL